MSTVRPGEIRLTVEQEPVQRVCLLFGCVPVIWPLDFFPHASNIMYLFLLFAKLLSHPFFCPQDQCCCFVFYVGSESFFFQSDLRNSPVNWVTRCQPHLCSSLKFCWHLNQSIIKFNINTDCCSVSAQSP